MYKLMIICLVLIWMSSCNNDNNHAMEGEKTIDSASREKEKSAEIKNILFFGNSLTAGYGLDDPSESFPSRIQEKIDSLRLPYRVINGGLSGETTSGGKNRVDWLLRQKIDVFVLELGANDGLRGIPVDETARNLQVIIDKVRAKYPEAKLVLLGMEIPPNMGAKYAADFRAVFSKTAERNHMAFVPFLLKGVAGLPQLNLQDGIHPTAQGYTIVAENVWKVLENVLEKDKS